MDGLQSIFISLVCTHTHDFSDGHFGFGNLKKSMGRPKETLDLAYARSHLGYVVQASLARRIKKRLSVLKTVLVPSCKHSST